MKQVIDEKEGRTWSFEERIDPRSIAHNRSLSDHFHMILLVSTASILWQFSSICPAIAEEGYVTT